ncbi:MAG: cell division protein FtsZ, partial [Erythrobacter sp.]|nr:cell division protein FtsZ [Erythrobacter sp.]
TTFKEAFMLADEVLQQGVRSITDLMVMPGLINLDFADVRSVMSEMGKAMMGTGEGEGDNRALEAAERAIANPLLDGVSMAGAKGVIISIIGGEDMKLLEVDEAANHIRELVDEDANIIWGSAFNPDLDGKIRVSVVATGIEHDGRPAQSQSRSFTMSESRAPKRPALELPRQSEEDSEPFELSEGLSADVDSEPASDAYARTPAPAPASRQDEDEPMELTTADYAEERQAESRKPAATYSDLDDEEDEDVDDIVDPLAGLRNEHTERFDRADASSLASPTDSRSLETDMEDEGWGRDSGRRPTLDLSDDRQPSGRGQSTPQDELQLGNDQMAASSRNPLQSKPARQGGESAASSESGRGAARPSGGQGGQGGNAGSGGASSGGSGSGSTLFERMANLSRGSASRPAEDRDDEDDDDTGGALNIPRFLGRQNNQ